MGESANRPITPEADDILADNGIHVLPDIFANAGGVTASYYEWVQDIEHHSYSWPLDEINGRFRAPMQNATDRVVVRRRAFARGLPRRRRELHGPAHRGTGGDAGTPGPGD